MDRLNPVVPVEGKNVPLRNAMRCKCFRRGDMARDCQLSPYLVSRSHPGPGRTFGDRLGEGGAARFVSRMITATISVAVFLFRGESPSETLGAGLN